MYSKSKSKSFWASEGPLGSQKTHIGIQKGPTHCWIVSTDHLTPIWPSVVTKGTSAQLFGPKNLFLISFWAFKGPFWLQKAHIVIQKDPLHYWVITNDRLTPIGEPVRTFFGPKISI